MACAGGRYGRDDGQEQAEAEVSCAGVEVVCASACCAFLVRGACSVTLAASPCPAILAHEYGFLDAKHGMGYEPRPSGHEKAYAAGYQSARCVQATATVPVGTYADKTNWGWY